MIVTPRLGSTGLFQFECKKIKHTVKVITDFITVCTVGALKVVHTETEVNSKPSFHTNILNFTNHSVHPLKQQLQ